MNKRIQELADEAEIYADSVVDLGGEFHPAYTQKLAELIVRECVEMSNLEAAHYRAQADKAESKQAFDFEFNSAATCLGVGLRIKKHFGVEE
jgi:hypothetical protein